MIRQLYIGLRDTDLISDLISDLMIRQFYIGKSNRCLLGRLLLSPQSSSWFRMLSSTSVGPTGLGDGDGLGDGLGDAGL
jgi:hypothetical protein